MKAFQPSRSALRSPSATWTRRQFLASSAAAAVGLAGCQTRLPGTGHRPGLIDTHTHFYDPTRPEGVPWPPPNDPLLHRPVYPAEFEQLARPHGVTGTVVVEASAWYQDNQWLLDLASQNPTIRGVVGNVRPGRPEFVGELTRLAEQTLFRGIRIGVWDKPSNNAALLRDLRSLADLNLTLDVLTDPDRLPEVAGWAKAVPPLRIVVDHCANVAVRSAPPPPAWLAGVQACARHPNIYMKVSGLVEGTGRNDGSAPSDPSFYQPTLDAIWDNFGPERVIFGSNWPVSARFASYGTVFGIVEAYFKGKGTAAAEKYFRRNASQAYALSPA